MNPLCKRILVGIALLATILSSTAFAGEQFTIRTIKVGDRLIGVTDDYRVVAIVCHRGLKELILGTSAEMIFPNPDGELTVDSYTGPSRTPIRRSPFRTLSSDAIAAICTDKPGEFDLAINGDQIDLIGAPRALTAQSWNEISRPY
jgi:hypothetical protein